MTAAPAYVPPTREAVAHHEAGHALVMLACGWRLTRVTIDPTPDALGMVSHRMLEAGDLEAFARGVESGDPVRRWHGRCGAVMQARVSLAGPVAEGIYTGSPAWRAWSRAIIPETDATRPHPAQYDDDVTNVLRALEIAAAGTLAFLGYQNRLGREVRAYLTSNRRIVEDVAALLLREGTAEGEAVRAAAWESAERHGLKVCAPSCYAPWWKPPAARRAVCA